MEMVLYHSHKEIPTKYRRVILDEVFEKRVAKVPLALCNQIINTHLEEQQEMETLKDFEVRVVKNGQEFVGNFKTLRDAEVYMDQMIDFGEDLSPVMLLTQAKRTIRAFVNGKWNFVLPKDTLLVKRRNAA
jgi:hypothetical protein